MYNMVKANHMNKELFVRLDSILDTNMFEEEAVSSRYAYAALYSYYTFHVGRPENISFFERKMPDLYTFLRKVSRKERLL
jgi:hypothetical protein